MPHRNSDQRIVTVLFLLFVFLWVCGILLIIFGAITCEIENENRGLRRFTSFSVGGLSIAVGAVLFLLAFFAGCAMLRLKNNPRMLLIYTLIVFTLCTAQCMLGCFALRAIRNENGEMSKGARSVIGDLFKRYTNNSQDRQLVDSFQADFVCCGVDNSTEWESFGAIPSSCCTYQVVTCTTALAYEKGCAEVFEDVIIAMVTIIAGITICFAFIELVMISYAWFIRNRLKHLPSPAATRLITISVSE